AFGEEFAQVLDGAVDTLSRGVVGRAEGLADFAQAFVLEESEQDGGAVSVVERVHGVIKEWLDLRPFVSGGVHGIHLHGDLFTELPAGLTTDDINSLAAGDLIEPCGEDG